MATASFEDALHPDAPALIQRLHDLGIVPIVASGDTPAAVAQCAAALGLKFHHGGLLPQDKLALVQEYQQRGRTLMLGDGINDAIALNAADIGMSMAHGTAVAQESADIVLTREGLPQIPQFFVLSRLTMQTIKGNLWWAFGYNIIAIPIAAGAFSVAYGLELTPIMASIAMSFSSLGVVANPCACTTNPYHNDYKFKNQLWWMYRQSEYRPKRTSWRRKLVRRYFPAP